MNIYGYLFSFLTGPVLIVLFIAALVALFLPLKFISFKTRLPVLYYTGLILALFVQFPLLFGGCWGLGMQYAESKLSKIIDISYVGLIVLYIMLFFLSFVIQGKKKELEQISTGTALFASLILSPLIHLVFMSILGKLLLGN